MKIRTILKRAIKNAKNAEEHLLNYNSIAHCSDKDSDQLEKCSIHINDLYSLKGFLQELSKFDHSPINEKDIPVFLNHENAHANMADIVGATHEGYTLIFLKEATTIIFTVYANVEHPSDWYGNPERLRDLIRIFNAPNEYGDKTSFSDNNKIAELKLLLVAHEK